MAHVTLKFSIGSIVKPADLSCSERLRPYIAGLNGLFS
jgi:hypothetical protein